MNIKEAILKHRLEDDIIVYRKEYDVSYLEKQIEKFWSISVTIKGAFSGNPNVAILVFKGIRGAYIELLSKRSKQRKFLLDNEMAKKNSE